MGVLQLLSATRILARGAGATDTDQRNGVAKEVDTEDPGNGCRINKSSVDRARTAPVPRTAVATSVGSIGSSVSARRENEVWGELRGLRIPGS